jgi:hypothetical protein
MIPRSKNLIMFSVGPPQYVTTKENGYTGRALEQGFRCPPARPGTNSLVAGLWGHQGEATEEWGREDTYHSHRSISVFCQLEQLCWCKQAEHQPWYHGLLMVGPTYVNFLLRQDRAPLWRGLMEQSRIHSECSCETDLLGHSHTCQTPPVH